MGRNCLADAREVVEEMVFTKTAIIQLEDVKLVGREKQLYQVNEALNKFSLNHNQFLIAEGTAGIGKSEFLSTISRNLVQSKVKHVLVSGEPQEMFRPYYLATKVLVNLLKTKKDGGKAVLEQLNPAERTYLSQFLPHLAILCVDSWFCYQAPRIPGQSQIS